MTNTAVLFEYEFEVQETHLDTFGHMNHATYLMLYEQARWEFITERGYGLQEILAKQVGPTILEANINYKRELRLREKIKVQTTFVEWTGKIGKVHQRMVNHADKICSELQLVFGLFDMQKRQLINGTPEWLYAIGATPHIQKGHD